MSNPVNNPNPALQNPLYYDDGVLRAEFEEALAVLTRQDIIEKLNATGASTNAPFENLIGETLAQKMVDAFLSAGGGQEVPVTLINTFPPNPHFEDLNSFQQRIFMTQALSIEIKKFNSFANRVPRNFNDFIDQLFENSSVFQSLNGDNILKSAVSSVVGDFFVELFEMTLGVRSIQGGTIGSIISDNDFSVLADVDPPINFEDLLKGNDQITGYFEEFAASYPYGQFTNGTEDSGPGFDGVFQLVDSNFLLGESNFAIANFVYNFLLSSSAVASLQATVDPNSIYSLANPSIKLNSFEQVYKAYNPGATTDDFKARLVEFYQEAKSLGVAFVPSRVFDGWVDAVQRDFISGKGGDLTLPFVTSLTGNKSEKVAIMNRIIRLVSLLIDTIQKVTATQADQLTFLTQLQERYTTLQNNIPIFTSGQGFGLGAQINSIGGDDSKRRDQLNSFNQQMIELVRGRKSIEENKAKQAQTLVNQLNDGVQQQSEAATSLLQQLDSLLQAIYR